MAVYRDEQGRFELDYDSTLDDFINSEHHVADYRNRLDARVVGEYLPKFRRSLRVGVDHDGIVISFPLVFCIFFVHHYLTHHSLCTI